MQNSEKKVGIIGAMDIEVKTLISQLKPLPGEEKIVETVGGGRTFVEGLLEGTPVVIVQCGVGKVNAALCAQRLILNFGVTHIINTGIAGAMAAGLMPLDFVVSEDAVYHDFNVVAFGYKPTQIPGMNKCGFDADCAMIKAAELSFKEIKESEGHNLVTGRIATGDQFINEKSSKDYIKEICSPCCVEMEGAAIAHACYVNEVSFVIIRCMSDMADESAEQTYDFNEEMAAEMSANLVKSMLNKF